MGRSKTARTDPYAKRMGETDLQWRSRVAKLDQDERDRTQPLVTVEAQSHGSYIDQFITHVESGTVVKATRNRFSDIVNRWFAEGHVGFEEPARAAINRCMVLWDARPIVGRLCAGYEPSIRSGSPANDYGILAAIDDTRALERYQSWFHPAHWDVFENVVRHGVAAGIAGSDLAANPSQSIASARAVVGLVANVIAERENL